MPEITQEKPTEVIENEQSFDTSAVLTRIASEAEAKREVQETPQEAPQTLPDEGKPAEPTDEPPLRAKQLAALERRERALREREAKIDGQVAERVKAAMDDLGKKFRLDPVAFAKESGVEDFAQLASQYWYGALGDSAPEDFKKQLADQALKGEVAQLRAKLDSFEKNAEVEKQNVSKTTQVNMLDAELARSAQNLGETTPCLKALAGRNPQDAYEALCAVAAGLIQAGQWPSPSEVVEAVESGLKEEYDLFAAAVNPSPVKVPPKAPQGTERKPGNTLTSADHRPVKTREPDTGLLSDDEYVSRGIAAYTSALKQMQK